MRLSGCLLALCLAAVACGKGAPNGRQCQHNFDCKAGEGCVDGACEVRACGGCQPDEACGSDGNCVAAQGVSCADHTCPAAYPCNSGGVCARPCTRDSECDTGFLCNAALKSCTECAFDSQCAGKTGKPVCNADTGYCAACNANFDCVKALGAGHYCDAHACKPGCKTTADCNAALSETCDTSTTPGKCVQCHINTDCQNAFGASAGACDDTGHCVQCWGTSQADASKTFCADQECNLATKTCVQCLPANDATGQDCGYPYNGQKYPENASVCDPGTYTCVPGCQTDAQCGCPPIAPGGAESDCRDPDGQTHRVPDQEHCDPARTTMVGVSGPTRGACVQCTSNTHCEYKIATVPASLHPYGTMNGARCVNDSCVQGCDTDNDCWPDHATSNGKICHLGNSLDPNNHKCVQCKCDVLSDDGTYCEVLSNGQPACAAAASGAPRVCDAATLDCRPKRQGEQCVHSTECGDNTDPSTTCVGSLSLCVYSSHDGAGTGPTTYCAPDHSSYGRCGVPCDDFQNNYCTGTTHCPVNSACRQASGDGASGAMCVTVAPSAQACTY
ncbi:MAG: hypothetical protein ABR567_12525 [Myxococcales bacterium]